MRPGLGRAEKVVVQRADGAVVAVGAALLRACARETGGSPPPADRCTQPSRFGTRIVNT